MTTPVDDDESKKRYEPGVQAAFAANALVLSVIEALIVRQVIAPEDLKPHIDDWLRFVRDKATMPFAVNSLEAASAFLSNYASAQGLGGTGEDDGKPD